MSRKDVEAAHNVWLKAFNGGDASGVAQLYTLGGRLMPPGVEILEGRSSIEPFIKEFVQTGAQLSFELVTVHETPDLCAVVGRYVMDIPGAPQDRGKFIEVWTRQGDGSWQIAEDIFNSSVPPAG